MTVVINEEPDDGYHEYTSTDVDALVDIVRDSQHASAVSAALVLDDLHSSLESFQTSQKLLKQALQHELLEKNLGALNPEKTRLMNIVFVVEDARLVLDDKGLPVFRPGDKDIPPLGVALATKLIEIARTEAEQEKERVGLSKYLFDEVFGVGKEGQVESLQEFAKLSSLIYSKLREDKSKAAEALQVAKSGLTVEELRAKKTTLTQQIHELEDQIRDKESEKTSAESQLASLDVTFKELVSDVTFSEDLPDISALLGDDPTSSVVEALFDTIIQQYETKAEQEKTASSARAIKDELETQRLRTAGILQSNGADQSTAQERLSQLHSRLATVNNDIQQATRDKNEADERASQAQSSSANAQQMIDGLNRARTSLDTIAVSDSNWSESDLSIIETYVSVDILRSQSGYADNCVRSLSEARDEVTRLENLLRSRQSSENSALSAYNSAQTTTRSRKQTYDSTAAKISSGKSKMDNPEKEKNRQKWKDAESTESRKRTEYENAKSSRQSTERELSSARDTVSHQEEQFSSHLQSKKQWITDIENDLDEQVGTMNQQRMEANIGKTNAETDSRAYQLIIDSKTSEKSSLERDIDEAQRTLQELQNFANLIQSRLDDIIATISRQTSDDGQHESASTPTPEQESAMALQLRQITEQRKTLSASISSHTQALAELRKQKLTTEVELQDTNEDLDADPTERDQKILVAEQTFEETIHDVVLRASQQLNAIITTAGYESLSSWSGVSGEDKSVALLRLLVTDIKGLATQAEFRKEPAKEAYEQFLGSDISKVDVDSVERIVAKLHSQLLEKASSVENASAKDILDTVEPLVRTEFSTDADVKPFHLLLVNICESEDDTKWRDYVLNAVPNRTLRLIYNFEEVYTRFEDPVEKGWNLLRLGSEMTLTPLENSIEDLTAVLRNDWALSACATYLVESWLRNRSLQLASIEDLGEMINNFESLRKNPHETIERLEIFRQTANVRNEDVTFRISKWAVERVLNIRDAAVKAEAEVVDSSQGNIVSLAARTRNNFAKFTKDLFDKGISVLSKEIMRRKSAILSGDVQQLHGAASSEASALQSEIEMHRLSIEAAEKQQIELQQKYEKANTQAAAIQELWEAKEKKLEDQIREKQSEIEGKSIELTEALNNQSATEANILQQLRDSAKLREELAVLSSQRDHVEGQVESARTAADGAAQDLNRANGEVAALNTKKQDLENLKRDAERKRDDLTAWISFVQAISSELSEKKDGVAKRFEFATQYKTLSGRNVQEVFDLIGNVYPNLKADADKFAESANALKSLDLRDALDQNVVKYPAIDYEPKSTTRPGQFTIKGNTLSYSEVEHVLLNFVTMRCNRAGFVFNQDGKLSARDSTSIVSFKSTGIPDTIRELIHERIKLFFNPTFNGSLPSWDEYLEKQFAEASDLLDQMTGWCGITKWDVARAYASTVEVVVGGMLLIDKPVQLPGLNFFVTAGSDIHVMNSCDITTSPAMTIELKNPKARPGSSYPSDPQPNGRHGDDGQNAPAGMNAGHVTLRAYETLSWDSQLIIEAIGAVGAKGQSGGDGDEGRKGAQGKPAVPKDTDGWGNRQVSWGWTRYPGCENDGSLSTKPERIRELSGSGGDGGQAGAGGQGGSGGEVILQDKHNTTLHEFSDAAPISSDEPNAARTLQFGNSSLLLTSRNGKNGQNGSGIGRGGRGGDPGQKGVEKVLNKQHFFEKTKTKTGYIRKNYTEGLVQHRLGISEEKKDDETWGWRRYVSGYSYTSSDWDNGIRPFMSAEEAEQFLTSEMSRGSTGTPGKGAGGSGGSQHAKQREREKNKNISADDEYQRQKYQTVQTIRHEEMFTKIGNEYISQKHELQQQVDALAQQINTVNEQKNQAQETLNRVRERSEQLSTKSEDIQQQLQVISSVISKTTDQIVESDKVAISQIISGMEQSETVSQLSQQLQDIMIDNKFSARALSQLQNVAVAIQALQLAKQMEIQKEQNELSQQVEELTSQLLQSEQSQGELANLNTVSTLEELLRRTQQLQQDQTTQQQQKQKSVQVEADPEDDTIDHLIGSSILLSVRDTFAKGEDTQNVWPSLTTSTSIRAVEQILAAVPHVPEDKRALTIELLEILVRYAIFSGQLNILDDMSPLSTMSEAHLVVIDKLQSIDATLREDHWFIGSLTGATLMITSSENITVDEASLTSRYEQVEGIPVFGELTKLEREAAKLVNELKSSGVNLQHIAQFLAEYKANIVEAQMLLRQGYLSILQGKPVKLIDKLSRITLTFFKRTDDALAVQNIELALGIAKTIKSVTESIGVMVLENALNRKRDIRGGGGYTRLLMANAEKARPLFSTGEEHGALVAMRNADAPPETQTVYGPRDLESLKSVVQSVSLASSPAEVASKMSSVSRALSAGIAARTESEIMQVLGAIRDISFSTKDAAEKLIAASGPMSACAAIASQKLSILLSRGNEDSQAILFKAITSRLSVPFLSGTERVRRVIAFFFFVNSTFWEFTRAPEEVNWSVFQSMLNSDEIPYPAKNDENTDFIASTFGQRSYESFVEYAMFNIYFRRPEYSGVEGMSLKKSPVTIESCIEKILGVNPEQASLVKFLRPFALRTKSSLVEDLVSGAFETNPPTTVQSLRDEVQKGFGGIDTSDDVEAEISRVLSSVLLKLPFTTLQNLWNHSASNLQDMSLLTIAMVQSKGDSVNDLNVQFERNLFLWKAWPASTVGMEKAFLILHEVSTAVLRSTISNTLALLDQFETDLTVHLKELLSSALNVLLEFVTDVPQEDQLKAHAANLYLVSCLGKLVQQNNERKEELGHTTSSDGRPAAYLQEDNSTVLLVLELLISFMGAGSQYEDINAAIVTVMSKQSSTETESLLRQAVAELLKGGSSLGTMQLSIGHRLYMAMLKHSEDKKNVFLDTDEALHVAQALLVEWEKRGDVDCRTAALAIYQVLALEIRDLERKDITALLEANADAQEQLIRKASDMLPTSTVSFDVENEISEALVSENERRQELWKTYISQINDEGLQKASDVWEEVSESLGTVRDPDVFEQTLARHVNSLIYLRRSTLQKSFSSGVPEALAQATRKRWATTGWNTLDRGIKLAGYDGVTSFDLNEQLSEMIDVVALLLPMIDSNEEEEDVTEVVERGNAIAWILNGFCDAYDGMRLVPGDDELEFRLALSVEDISRHAKYFDSSAGLKSALNRLATILDRIDARKGRYSQVTDIGKETYTRSYLKRSLDTIDDKTAQISTLITRAASIGDVLESRAQALLNNFVSDLRQSKAFKGHASLFQEKLELKISVSTAASDIDRAKKRLLSIRKNGTQSLMTADEQASILTFGDLVHVCGVLEDVEEEVIELVKAAYSARFGLLAGRLHFILGLAQESDFNPSRGSKEQKEATRLEYNEAAKNGSESAYNNMLVNAFVEARNDKMTFDEARSLVLEEFQNIAQRDANAALNVSRLLEDRAPVQKYIVVDDAIMGFSEKSVVFSAFNKTIRQIIPKLEEIIYASASSNKALSTLSHIFDDRMDTLFDSLDGKHLQLSDTTSALKVCLAETTQRVRTSPQFENLGGFSSALSHLYQGTGLTEVNDATKLLLTMDDMNEALSVLFLRENNVLYNTKVTGHRESLQNIINLLPKLVDARLNMIRQANADEDSDVRMRREAMVKRILVASIKHLGSVAKAGVDSNRRALEMGRSMLDAIFSQTKGFLSSAGIQPEDLFNEDEKVTSELVGSDATISAIHEAELDVSGKVQLKPPFLWADALYNQSILHILRICTYASLTGTLEKLRETFWSPSLPREGQAPLTLAESEVNKIEEAMQNIFDPSTIDSIDQNDQYYQNIFNAGHYILYLITRDYISKVRRPLVTKDMENNRQALERLEEQWKNIDQEAGDMVVVIKDAAQQLLDAFSVAKAIHERLIVVESVFEKDAYHVFKLFGALLELPGASPVGFVRAISLTEAIGPGAGHQELMKVLTRKEEQATLDGIVLASAFNFIEAGVLELCNMLHLTEQEKANSVTRVNALRQQDLATESGAEFVTLLFGIVNGMVSEAKQDKSTNAASKEEVDALLESLQMVVQSQAWRSMWLLGRLKVLVTPMKWVPALDAYSIAISLSFDPETTTEKDTYWFQKAAQAVQRFRSRRGSAVAQDLLECLQIIVQRHANAETLAKIAASVSSNIWPFSASDKSAYQDAANLESPTDVLIHLENIANQKRAEGGERSFSRLIGLLQEDKNGVNKSISHLLETEDAEQVTKLEKRVTQIYDLIETHSNDDGKLLKDWKKNETTAWATEFRKNSPSYFTEEHTDEINLMLAVFSVVTGKVKKYERPRNPQLLSAILLVDSMVRGKGQLAELGTGEGKSLLVMMLATACVFKGETVDIITSSRVLAERDANDAQEWFERFDMHVTNNCDDAAEADATERQKRYRENAIVYGTTGAFERDLLLTQYYGKDIRSKAGDNLIVDEVDTLLIDNLGNTLYISHSIQDLKHMNHLFVSIWRAVHAKDAVYYSESSVAIVKQLIQSQIRDGTLLIPKWLDKYMKSRLDIWIRNAYNAKNMEEGDQYKLYETGRKRGQVVVIDLYTGVEMPSTQWSNGLHQFVQLKHNNKLSAESLKAIFVANIRFVNQYSGVMGCTGTLGGSTELELLKRLYQVDAFRMPRFKEERYYEESAVVVGNKERWLELLCDEIISKSKYSEGFDVEKTKLDAAENEAKLEKDKKKVKKLEAKIISREAEVEETEQLETDLLSSVVSLRTTAQVNNSAIQSLKSLISDLEDSEAIEDGDEAYGLDRVNTLSLAVERMEKNLESIRTADAQAQQLSQDVDDLKLQLRQESLQGDTASINEITQNLESKKEESASKEEYLKQLRGESEVKANNLITALSEARQGFSFIAKAHIEELREKISDDKIDLEEEREDVIKHTRRLESSREALANGSGGRAVLVICRNKNDCEDVRDALVSREEASITLYVYTGTTEGITKVSPMDGTTVEVHASLSELKPHDVIIATNIAGRGTSLKTTEVLEQCGGLHVVLSYVPSNVRVEVQAWGRTARHGSNGSGRFIVYDPRVISSEIPVDIDYLLSERDVNERERLEDLETKTVPRVELESVLFEEFGRISQSLKSTFSSRKRKLKEESQLKELRDQWAFFLESHDETLEKCYLHPEKSKRELLAALQTFKSEQEDAAKGKLGLIQSPGNLLLLANDALRRSDYEQTKEAAKAIIEKDKQFAAFGYYYHALARFGSGTSDTKTKGEAVKELDKAVFLLKRMSDQLLEQSQIISSINSITEGRGLGTDTLAFEKSNSNMQSLLQIHISAAEKITGRALKEDDFDTSAINGDATKQVFDIINDEKKLRSFFSPLRITADIEIRLRISAASEAKTEISFLQQGRIGDDDRYKWEGDVLEVADVTQSELDQLKTLGVTWELALYRIGNEFETQDRVRITFQQDYSYAVPKMLENLHQLSQDDDGNPMPFSDIDEDKLAEVKQLLFSTLLSQEEIKGFLNEIVSSDTPDDYLVVEQDYVKKAYGKWDEVRFRGVGTAMKTWILDEFRKGSPIQKSRVRDKAHELLQAKGEANALSNSEGVVDAVVAQGVAKEEQLSELRPNVLSIISEENTSIFVKPDVLDKFIDNLPLDGFKLLERHKEKILACLRKSKGKKISDNDFILLLPEDEQEEAISSNAFFTLQALTRASGVSKYLCERLGLSVDDHKKEPLDDILRPLKNTLNISSAAKTDSASKLQKDLITKKLLDLPRVDIGIDSVTGSGKGTKSAVASKTRQVVNVKSSDHSDEFSNNLKSYLEDQIKTIASKVKAKDQELKDKTKEMMDDIIEAFKGSITELATTLTGTLKVDFQTLTQRITDEESVPPELIDFVAIGAEITFKLVKKKTFADYWDWGAFAVALIGLVQVVAGAVILVVTAGAATNIAGALIGEGIGDMIYATTAGLTGTFSWKEYGIQKAISLGVTLTVGLATAGIGTVVSKAASTAAVATKVAVSAVVKAVAKKVTGEIIKAAVTYGIGMGAQKLSELATGEIMNLFKKNFRSMAESNVMCQESVKKIKDTLSAMMDTYGKAKATKYVTDAITDAATGAAAGLWETNITAGVVKAATEIANSLGAIGKRMEQSGHKWTKIVASASQWIGYAARASGVIDAVQQIVRYLPAIYDNTNKRLIRIHGSPETTPKDVLVGTEKTEWITKHMKSISDKIYKAVEALTANGIIGTAVNEALGQGFEKLSARTIDKLSRDYEELETRAVGAGIIKKLGSQDTLTQREREALVDLQTQMTDPKNKYPSVLTTVNPAKDPSVKVMFNGKITDIGNLTGIMGTKGLKVLPTKTGEAYGILVRPKYQEYVSGISIHKDANLFDLRAMAKAANVNVALTYAEKGEKKSLNIDSAGGDAETVKIQLLKNDDYPQGRYVLLDDDGNIKMRYDFESIGNASCAQVLLYASEKAKSSSTSAALENANSPDKLKKFLTKVRKEAMNDEHLQNSYVEGEHEIQNRILGGSSPHPLPLVPVPRQPVLVFNVPMEFSRLSPQGIGKDLPRVPVLSRALPLVPTGADMSLTRKSLDRGYEGADVRVITIQTSNRTLKSFLGVDQADEGVLTRPRITLAAISRVKEVLSSLPIGDQEPLRFVVETERAGDRGALEIRRNEVKYGFAVDGHYETGILTTSELRKIEDSEAAARKYEESEAEAVEVEDMETNLTFVESLSSSSDLETSTGILEYGFEFEDDTSVGLTKWATMNVPLDSQTVLHMDDISIEDLEV